MIRSRHFPHDRAETAGGQIALDPALPFGLWLLDRQSDRD
jgi:hypothetical protein